MDERDRGLLNRIQSELPLVERPFREIGKELGMPEDEILERLGDLKAQGIIRRIGGNFVPRKLGFVSTLCAAKVPEEKINAFSRIVNRYPGVTHNYIREAPYNAWFTFIAPSTAEIETALEKIAEEAGIPPILNLPATKVFKIRAQFNLSEPAHGK